MTCALMLATVFVHPIPIRGEWRLLMMVPLVLSVAIVYKTIHGGEMSGGRFALSSLTLCVTIVVGMLLVGAGLGALFLLLA
jgi:hypothetical protein